jgi:hypothetical protein
MGLDLNKLKMMIQIHGKNKSAAGNYYDLSRVLKLGSEQNNAARQLHMVRLSKNFLGRASFFFRHLWHVHVPQVLKGIDQ